MRSCILCFETVLGVNKIIPTPTPLQKIKKTQKINFLFAMIFWEKLFEGVGASYFYFNRYKIFEYNKKKLPLLLPLPQKLVFLERYFLN